jgi:hypothetical protein
MGCGCDKAADRGAVQRSLEGRVAMGPEDIQSLTANVATFNAASPLQLQIGFSRSAACDQLS